MKYLHTMIRVYDLEAALNFFKLIGLKEIRRNDQPQWECTLVFLATEDGEPEVELTYNWGQKEAYTGGRNFGHLAYSVENIYETCQKLMDGGVTILRPPHDGRMAFVRSPDQISIEILQKGEALKPQEPWTSMPKQGEW
ncbi:MAG: VOC family protein [SAR324 cluster bacterium]|nr:VOC family protein [SAR324 cluster bacterium]